MSPAYPRGARALVLAAIMGWFRPPPISFAMFTESWAAALEKGQPISGLLHSVKDASSMSR